MNAIRSQNPPGRFLDLEPHLGSWIEVDDRRAVEKTCQTFRKKNNYNRCEITSISSTPIFHYVSTSSCINLMSNIGKVDSPMKPRAFSSNGFTNNLCCQQPSIEHSVSVGKESKENVDYSMHDDYIFRQLEIYYHSEQGLSSIDSNNDQHGNGADDKSANSDKFRSTN